MCKGMGWRILPFDSAAREQARGRRELQHLYASRRTAERAARRLTARLAQVYIVERVCGCPVPGANDARGWDSYRLAHGIASR